MQSIAIERLTALAEQDETVYCEQPAIPMQGRTSLGDEEVSVWADVGCAFEGDNCYE